MGCAARCSSSWPSGRALPRIPAGARRRATGTSSSPTRWRTRWTSGPSPSSWGSHLLRGAPRPARPLRLLASGLGAPAPGRPCGSHCGPATARSAHHSQVLSPEVARPLALLLALALDLAFGDPPNRYHPVAWLGRLLEAGRRRLCHGSPAFLLVVGAAIPLAVAGLAGVTGAIVAAVTTLSASPGSSSRRSRSCACSRPGASSAPPAKWQPR